MPIVKRTFLLLAALLVWVTLGFQFHFFMIWAENHHFPLLGAIWSFFSFFTNISNILAGICLLAAARRSQPSALRQQGSLYAATALYLCITSVIFNLELSDTVSRSHPTYFINVILHDVIPLLFLGFWLFVVPRAYLKARHAAWWLLLPTLYFVQILLRGWLIRQYPYDFFNAIILGYPAVLLNGLEILMGLMLVGLIFVGIDRIKRR